MSSITSEASLPLENDLERQQKQQRQQAVAVIPDSPDLDHKCFKPLNNTTHSAAATMTTARTEPSPATATEMNTDTEMPRPVSSSVGLQMELCEFRVMTAAKQQHSERTKLQQQQQQQDDNAVWERYQDTHPLVYDMLRHEQTRTLQLQREGSKQIFYPKSNEDWFTSLRVIEGRALDNCFAIWCLVVLHAALYTCLQEWILADPYKRSGELSSWETFFGIALNGTLSLMLVFRLNRAAERWWKSRELWGVLVTRIRTLCTALLVHGGHDPVHRDEAIRWMAAYALCTMEFLRGLDELDEKLFAGILSPLQVACLERKSHPPLFAAQEMHHHLQCLFSITADTPVVVGNAWSQQLATLQAQWNGLVGACGGMERIKATPLPVVYVSHLRTFLLLALLLYPYVWGHEWRWSTIPIVALAAFSMLGIEAASAEVEQPFRKGRVNALNMDGFCIGALSNIQQSIRQQADRELDQNGDYGEQMKNTDKTN